jgi:hypothetical protein
MITLGLFMLLAAADRRPGLRVSPKAGFAPLLILLTAELKGGEETEKGDKLLSKVSETVSVLEGGQ